MNGGNEIDHEKRNRVGMTKMLGGKAIPTGRRPDAGPDAILVGGLTPPDHRAFDQGAATDHAPQNGKGVATPKALAMQACVIALAATVPAGHQSASLKRNWSRHRQLARVKEMWRMVTRLEDVARHRMHRGATTSLDHRAQLARRPVLEQLPTLSSRARHLADAARAPMEALEGATTLPDAGLTVAGHQPQYHRATCVGIPSPLPPDAGPEAAGPAQKEKHHRRLPSPWQQHTIGHRSCTSTPRTRTEHSSLP